MHLALSPVVLGRGESLFAGVDLPGLGYRVTEVVPNGAGYPPRADALNSRSQTRRIGARRQLLMAQNCRPAMSGLRPLLGG